MIELTYDILNPERVTALVRNDTNGAVVTFLGTTRNNFQGRRVVTLEYEAFEEMAVKKLEEIRLEMQRIVDVARIALRRAGVALVISISGM